MLFLAFASSQNATAHLSRPIGESSMIVPTFTLNWRRGCLPLHSQRRYLARNFTSVAPHVGQCTTPSGQRALVKKSWATSRSEKYRTACKSVFGYDLFDFMPKLYGMRVT